jgi:hypothetical protein
LQNPRIIGVRVERDDFASVWINGLGEIICPQEFGSDSEHVALCEVDARAEPPAGTVTVVMYIQPNQLVEIKKYDEFWILRGGLGKSGNLSRLLHSGLPA